MAKNQQTKSPWGKILKLFIEFIIAALTAFITSVSGKAMNIW